MKKVLCCIFSVFILLCSAPSSQALPPNLGTSIVVCAAYDTQYGNDMQSWAELASNYLSNIPNAMVSPHFDFTATQLLGYLNTADICIVSSHGSPNSILAVDDSFHETTLTSSDISALPGGSLNNLAVAYLAGCRTGGTVNSGSNMVDAVYSKGAKCVIGYTQKVYYFCDNTMLSEFCRALSYEYSIGEALSYADAKVLIEWDGISGFTDQRYVRGDTTTIFGYYAPNNALSIPNNTTPAPAEIIYFSNENGTYGFFDPSKLSGENNTAAYSINSIAPVTESTAAAFLNTLCEDSQQYSLRDFYYTPDTGVYTAIYNTILCGTATTDFIYIMLNTNGELVSYAKPREGAFNGIEITSEMLQEAEETLYNTFDLSTELCSIDFKQIAWEDGVLSMHYYVETADGIGASHTTINKYTVPLA